MCLFPLVQPWKASHCLEGWLLLLLFSCPVASDSLWSHGLQHVRLLSQSLLHHLPEFAQIHVQWVSDAIHLILCHPLILPSIFPSIRIFSSESALWIKWPKYCRFSFSNSPSDEYSGSISLRIDWLDFLAVQRTLKSLLQHHRSKVSALWGSAFFMIQLSHPYMTTGKTVALTIRILLAEWCLCFLIYCLGLL